MVGCVGLRKLGCAWSERGTAPLLPLRMQYRRSSCTSTTTWQSLLRMILWRHGGCVVCVCVRACVYACVCVFACVCMCAGVCAKPCKGSLPEFSWTFTRQVPPVCQLVQRLASPPAHRPYLSHSSQSRQVAGTARGTCPRQMLAGPPFVCPVLSCCLSCLRGLPEADACRASLGRLVLGLLQGLDLPLSLWPTS